MLVFKNGLSLQGVSLSVCLDDISPPLSSLSMTLVPPLVRAFDVLNRRVVAIIHKLAK